MTSIVQSLLMARGAFSVATRRLPTLGLISWITLGAGTYGLIMGSLDGRWLAGWYSATKLPLLVFGTTALCLPSFYALNALMGLREDFSKAIRAILFAQGTVALSLGALAPVLGFVYLCEPSYPAALFSNGVLFTVAVIGGQVTLRRHYQPLIARNRRHRSALATWSLLYLFIAIKLGWVLRPFVGDPVLAIEYLRPEQWTRNPYSNLFWTAVGLAWKALEAF